MAPLQLWKPNAFLSVSNDIVALSGSLFRHQCIQYLTQPADKRARCFHSALPPDTANKPALGGEDQAGAMVFATVPIYDSLIVNCLRSEQILKRTQIFFRLFAGANCSRRMLPLRLNPFGPASCGLSCGLTPVCRNAPKCFAPSCYSTCRVCVLSS